MDATILSTACTCSRLRRLSRRTTRIYDEYLAPSGLTLTQYSLLSQLSKAGSDPDMHDLSELMGMDRTTLTRLLKPLTDSGLIAIRLCSDRRKRRVVLAEPGQKALIQARPLWQQAQDHIESRLGGANLATLHDLMDRAYQNLAEMPA